MSAFLILNKNPKSLIITLIINKFSVHVRSCQVFLKDAYAKLCFYISVNSRYAFCSPSIRPIPCSNCPHHYFLSTINDLLITSTYYRLIGGRTVQVYSVDDGQHIRLLTTHHYHSWRALKTPWQPHLSFCFIFIQKFFNVLSVRPLVLYIMF